MPHRSDSRAVVAHPINHVSHPGAGAKSFRLFLGGRREQTEQFARPPIGDQDYDMRLAMLEAPPEAAGNVMSALKLSELARAHKGPIHQ